MKPIRINILVIAALILVSCAGPATQSIPVPVHTWKDLGLTVSLLIERPNSIFRGSKATITCTKGQFWSFGDAPNPFITGKPVQVRDDGEWASIDGESYYLFERN